MSSRQSRPLRDSVILLCDIENYSLRKQSDQRALIQALWEEALRDEWLPSWLQDLQDNAHMWGTGDGFYVADWEVHETTYDHLYAFARRLIDRMKTEHEVGLRVALHCGHSDWVQDLPGGRREVAGTALNDTARIVGFAAGGQVVLSEDYFRALEKHGGGDTLQPNPAPGDFPFSIYVKHAMPMSVRFDSDKPSHRMRHLRKVSELIVDELNQIARRYSHSLSSPSEPSPQVRVSIFRPARDAQGEISRLVATQYRCCPTDRELERPSNSRFGIAPPVGLGAAYTSAEPRYVVYLPDPDQDFDAYCQRLHDEWNIEKSSIERWQRKPRSMFAIPLMLSSDDKLPSGVVCVDIMSPLQGRTDHQVAGLAQKMHALVMGRLALLWKLLE